MKPVIIYTTDYCPHCRQAKNLLTKKNIPFKEIDITHDDQKRNELEAKTSWMTVPLIFIGGKFIGGADQLHQLENAGELDRLLS